MEHPLIAKPHEVQAILAGRQSQLRRIVKLPNGRVSKKPQAMPDYIGSWINSSNSDLWAAFGSGEARPDGVQNTVNTMRTGWFPCPYGKVGDRLWVREKYFPMRYDWKELPGSPILYSNGFMRGRQAWNELYEGTTPPMGFPWKGAVTMPREASRILLEVTDIRCERLQAISEADAKAEAVAHLFSAEELRGTSMASSYFATPEESGYRNYLWHGLKGRHGHNLTYAQIDAWPYQYSSYDTAAGSYSSLWEAINGPGSWAANPWVWVITFKVIEPAATPTKQEGNGQR